MSKKRVVVALVLGLFIVAGVKFWHANTAAVLPEKPASAADKALHVLPQDVMTIQLTSANDGLPFTGEVISPNQVQITSPVAGKVTSLNVQEGQSVAVGDRLLAIHSIDLESQVNSRQAALNAAEADVKLARQTLARQQSLYQQHFISKNALDELNNQVVLKESQLASRRAELQQAQADQASTTIVAPIAGAVASRSVTAGQEINQHANLLTIVSLSDLEIQADIPAAAVANLRVGQAAKVQIEGTADTPLSADILRINPATTAGSRSIRVFLKLVTPDARARVGVFVTGELVSANPAGIHVPAASVFQYQGQSFVWVLDKQSHLQRQHVETAGAADQHNQQTIRSGLKVGDRVLAIPLPAGKVGQFVVVDAK